MKIGLVKVILVCISLIFAGLTGQSIAAIDPGTVVGLWLFDDGSGDVAVDSSGNGLDGELIDGPAWANGRFGGGLEFDGVASHLVIPDHANPTEAITVTAWVKSATDTWNQHGWIVEKRDAFIVHPIQGDVTVGWCVCNPGCWNQPGGWSDGAVGPDDITDWHMYTCTFDGSTGEWKIYIDGEVASELSINAGSLAEDVGPIYIANDT